MRILHRPRPQIHFRELIVFAIPSKEFLRGPRLQHQIDGLAPALALVHGRDTVADIGVATEPERHARNQAAAADAIEHRIFLGDADGRRGGGERGAELHQRDVIQALVARHLGQDGAEQIWIAHEPIGVLMVLVGADAIEAEPSRQHQFVDRPVIEIANLVGIAIFPPRRIHPCRIEPLREIVRQIAIRHEMETGDLHGSFLPSDVVRPDRAPASGFVGCCGDLT